MTPISMVRVQWITMGTVDIGKRQVCQQGEVIRIIHELSAEEQLPMLEKYLADPLYQMIRIDEKDELAWARYVRVRPDGFGEETTLMINHWAEKRIEVIDLQAEQETVEIRAALETTDPLPAYSVIQALRNHGELINQEAAVQTSMLRLWQQELKDWYEQNVRIKEETWVDGEDADRRIGQCTDPAASSCRSGAAGH